MAVTLSDQLVEFLHGRVGVYLASRDASLRPTGLYCFGAYVAETRQRLTVYVLASRAEPTLANLQQNGRMAVLVGGIGTHTSFQFKGRFVSVRPSAERDYAIQDIGWDKLMSYVDQLPSADVLRSQIQGWERRPTLAIEMEIDEVFDQAPRPGTGNRLAIGEKGAGA